MPQRRFITTDFFTDSRLSKCSPAERLLFAGMIAHADDEGRLLAGVKYLRSIVFPYDDYSAAEIQTMRDNLVTANPNVILYRNGEEDYIQLGRWQRYQKPRYPKPSIIPQPPDNHPTTIESPSSNHAVTTELPPGNQAVTEQSPVHNHQVQTSPYSQGREGLGGVGSVKSGIGRDRLGRDSVKGEGPKELNLPDDLTDFQMTDGTNNFPPAVLAETIWAWWERNIGPPEKPDAFLHHVLKSVKKHKLSCIVLALAKCQKYKAGRNQTWNYVEKAILELEGVKDGEKMATRGENRTDG